MRKRKRTIIDIQEAALVQMYKAGEVEPRIVVLKDPETKVVTFKTILHSVRESDNK